MHIADAFFSLHDRLLITIFGFLLHMLLLRLNLAMRLYPFTPFAWGADLMRWLEHRLNRVSRGQSALKFRGTLCTIILLFWCLILGFLLSVLAQKIPHGELLEMLLLCLALSARPALDICWQLLSHLKHKTEIPRVLLARLAHPAADVRDDHSVIRAGIENLITRYSTEVVSPIIWYLLAGMPGLVLCVSVTYSEKLLRARGLHGALFGLSLRVLYQLLHFIPARLAGLLISLGSVFIPSCHPVHAVFGMFTESGKLHTTPFGWVFGALAGALTLALGGPRSHYLLLKETPWIGSGSARPSLKDMARAMFLYGIALQLLLLVCALALYAKKVF